MQLNWQAIGTGIVIAGWYVVHILTKRREQQRDREARMRDENSAKSDFEFTLKKWLDAIEDKQQTALPSIRNKSIPEIEQLIRIVRPHLDSNAKTKLENEWKKYQSIDKNQLIGTPAVSSVTGNTIISYITARKILSEPLQKMLEIIRPSGAFGPGDIHPSIPDPR